MAYTSALETITQSRGAESHSAALYANRALALLKLLRPAEAEEDCCAALSIVPTHAKALLRRAEARIQLRQYVEAVDDLGLVLELEPKKRSKATAVFGETVARIRGGWEGRCTLESSKSAKCGA